MTHGTCSKVQQLLDTSHLLHRLHPPYLAHAFQVHWQDGAQLWRAPYEDHGWWDLALGLLDLPDTTGILRVPAAVLVDFLEEGQESMTQDPLDSTKHQS